MVPMMEKMIGLVMGKIIVGAKQELYIGIFGGKNLVIKQERMMIC